MSDNDPKQITFTISPEVKKKHDLYKFLQDSYEGGQVYEEGKYLIKHKRESKEDYELRLSRASFMNFCAPVVDIYTSYLFREEPTRTEKKKSTVVDLFLEDADMEGRPWNKVMRELSKLAGASSIMGVIIDKPKGEAASRGEELQNGIRPYAAIYNPQAILHWEFKRIDGVPTLTKLILKEGETEKLDQIIIWTRDNWKRYERETTAEGNKYILAEPEVENKLGTIPFALLRNRDSFKKMTGISDIADIATINKRVYYLDSDALEIIDETAYPMLEGDEDDLKGDGEKVVGTSSVLVRSNDSDGFRWVEAPHTSLPQILEWRHEAIDDIKYLAKIGSGEAQTSGNIESGVALELRFQQLNALLTEKAESAEDFEKRIFELIGKWEDEEIDIEITYPRKFGIRDLIYDLEIALSANAVVPSRTFQAEQGKIYSRRVLPNDTDEKILAAIDAELDQGPPEVEDENTGEDE